MRRSILLTVLALGAQAAWAQDATDPTGDGAVVEGTTEIVEQATDGGDGTEVTDETDVVEDEVDTGDEAVVDENEVDEAEIDDGAVVVDDDTAVVDETEVSEDGEAVRTDSRSARGAFRGGHHGQVSTLARAGLGPVFGKLRSQGYGDIAIEQVGGEITISAARAGETRRLVYDATTGALLSDISGPSSEGILRGFSSKLKKQSTVSSTRERNGSGHASGGGNGKGGGSGQGSGKGGDNGKGNGNGGGKGNGNGGGNGGGNGNGGGKGNGNAR